MISGKMTISGNILKIKLNPTRSIEIPVGVFDKEYI